MRDPAAGQTHTSEIHGVNGFQPVSRPRRRWVQLQLGWGTARFGHRFGLGQAPALYRCGREAPEPACCAVAAAKPWVTAPAAAPGLRAVLGTGCGLRCRFSTFSATALKMNMNLRELYLADNKLNGLQDSAQLGNLLKFNCYIQILDLRNNHILDSGEAPRCSSGQSPHRLPFWPSFRVGRNWAVGCGARGGGPRLSQSRRVARSSIYVVQRISAV